MDNSPVKPLEGRKAEDKSRKQDETVVGTADAAVCYWNGQSYSPGAQVCDNNGSLMKCYSDGSWSVIGTC